MKTSTRIFGAALLVAAAVVIPVTADASCAVGPVFGSYYSVVTGTTGGPSLRSSFWMMGNGNPLPAAGIDNGPVAETGTWLDPYPTPADPLILQGSWSEVTTFDGCPDTLGVGSSMAYALSDVNGAGNMVYAVGCSTRIGSNPIEFDMTIPFGCSSGCAPIALVPAPKALISGTTRSAGQANVTVASPNFAAGFYSDGTAGCAQNLVITHYDVYKQELGRGASAPVNADTTGGWTLVQAGVPIGTPTNFVTTCVANCDVYVSLLPAYNSGFKTGEPATGGANRVGPPSTRVQAGPTIADPPKPRIANPKKAAE